MSKYRVFIAGLMAAIWAANVNAQSATVCAVVETVTCEMVFGPFTESECNDIHCANEDFCFLGEPILAIDPSGDETVWDFLTVLKPTFPPGPGILYNVSTPRLCATVTVCAYECNEVPGGGATKCKVSGQPTVLDEIPAVTRRLEDEPCIIDGIE